MQFRKTFLNQTKLCTKKSVVATIFLKSRIFLKSGFLKSRASCTSSRLGFNFFFYSIIFRHGKNKFIAGAAIAGAGLLTGNAGITSFGTNLAGLGLKTKLAAHLFPAQKKNRWGK